MKTHVRHGLQQLLEVAADENGKPKQNNENIDEDYSDKESKKTHFQHWLMRLLKREGLRVYWR